jgi:L-asparaginase
MIPLGEPNSDAPFNLGFACAAATMYRENGVFIAFNGKIWDPDDVKKNIEDMRFEQT